MIKTILIFLAFLLALPNMAYANEPDSAYIRAFATDKNNNRNGLHLAWSIDRKQWHTIGNEYSFLRCDYGPWGTEKRMLNPVLLRDESGTWHCLWDVNERDNVFAYAASPDLVNWKPQSYRPKEEEQAFIASLGVIESDTENILRVRWSVIDGLTKAQQLSAYTKLLWNEQAKDDPVRFAGLKDLEATITVQTEATKKISDQLIGVFFEDINYAADGGLYAELVQNRDFEYNPASNKSWDNFYAWSLNGRNDGVIFRIDTVQPVHPHNPHYVYLDLNRYTPELALENTGWNGIALKKDEKYELSFFAAASTEKFKRMATVQLATKGKTIAETMIKLTDEKWKKYTAVLSVSESADDAILKVKVSDPGWYKFDMISLFPQKTFKGHKNGLRTDLAQAIADLKPRFVRFPGGCAAHGDALETIYRWKNTIGALESRQAQRNLWGYHQTAGLGYYEYFQFCEDIGAEPLPVVAAGVPCQNSAHNGHRLAGQQGGIPMDEMDEYVQDILDLIEWANGDKTTVWGRKRAEAGHPSPFNLKYIGVGNEDLITDVFEERFAMIYNAIKAKYPEITVIGTVGPFFEGADYVEGWDFATKLGVPVVDEHYYQSPAWFIYNQDFYDRYDRSKPKVYLGEYAAHLPGRPNNLETALAEALYLTAVERNGDVVSMTSYAPLLAKEGNTQWNPDLIYFNNTEVKPTVGYYVQKLYGENAGDEYLPASISLNNTQDAVKKRIACSVVRDSNSGDMIVKLVNMLPVGVNANMELPLPENKSVNASKTVLTGAPADKTARPVSGTIEVSKQFRYELPAYSFTVIRFGCGLYAQDYKSVPQTLNIYPVPQQILYSMHNDDFTVQVRLPGQDWQDLYEYNVQVDMDTRSDASMVQFDFEGKVEMKVRLNNGLANDVKIRPLAKGIQPRVEGNLIYLTLDKPTKLSLEVNGDRLHNLHIFANEPEKEIPDRNNPDVIVFEAGIHNPTDSARKGFVIPSNKTVYLAAGAILRGAFICDKVENVRFKGRGFLLNPERGFELTFSKNIEIDGITVINPTHYTVYGGQTDGLKINNLKSFSVKEWSDGIDLMSCSEVTINDIFMRNSDDCIAIYTHRWEYYGDVRNYKVTNAILWADIAHPINIGLHGDTSFEGNVIENLHFSDIDILEHDEDDRNYQGCMAFSVSDHNLVQNISFENVRAENIQEGQLFNLRVLFNNKYSSGPGRGVKNVTFKNIYCYDGEVNPSVIEGFSMSNQVENICFDNIVINNKKCKTLEEAGIRVGNFTKGIIIK